MNKEAAVYAIPPSKGCIGLLEGSTLQPDMAKLVVPVARYSSTTVPSALVAVLYNVHVTCVVVEAVVPSMVNVDDPVPVHDLPSTLVMFDTTHVLHPWWCT